jgi:hypothetical protein
MPFTNTYSNLPVLITGHTGFKGSWLTTWLLELGANVIGYSHPEPPTQPSNFVASNLAARITDVRGDIRDYDHLHARPLPPTGRPSSSIWRPNRLSCARSSSPS